MKVFGAVATTVLAAGIAGCSTTTEGPGTSYSAPRSSISQQSSTTANTPGPSANGGFPDLSGFTESIGQFNQVDVPRVQGFYFSTAGGLLCGSNAYPEIQFEYVSCRGPVPSQGPGAWAVRADYDNPATVASIEGDPDFEADMQSPPPVLPPMHKVTATKGDAVCALDDKGTVACRVHGHGFVITPIATKVF